MNDTIQYNSIYINSKKLAIHVDYDAQSHITIMDRVLSTTNEDVFYITVSPGLAFSLIDSLTELLEWYKSPLHQWAKRKTHQDNWVKFKRGNA